MREAFAGVMSPDVSEETRGNTDAPPRVKRILIGDPLTSAQVDDQLLPKKMALPIFASDAPVSYTHLTLPTIYSV